MGASAASLTAVVVFSRFDSQRLPGKSLADVAGRPLLCRVLDRVRSVPGTPPVIVATSDRPVDDPIADLARAESVGLFRGASDDVARRAHDCALAHRLDRLVRISGDSPFIDPALIGRMIAEADAGAADVVTNVFPRSYPPGTSVEVIATRALARVLGESADPEDREHVTRYMYRHAERFRIVNIAAPDGRFADVSLTVDWPADLEKAIWLVRRCGGGADLDTIVKAARDWARAPEDAR
jgi:spore coat polysaccharide biosynthesis protein SpsF